MTARACVALGCFFVLALVLRVSHGTYHETGLIVLTGLLGLFVYLARTDRRPRAEAAQKLASLELVLWMLVAAGSALMALEPRLVTAGGPTLLALRFECCLVALLACCWVARMWRGECPPERLHLRAICLCGLALLAARLLTLFAAPSPQIDVYVSNSLACDYLLAGDNPYTQAYPDIYRGRFAYDQHFFYWPAYLYSAVPFRLLGDVRYLSVAADLGTAGLLFALGTALGFQRPAAGLVSLIWLSWPISLLVAELAWIDPLLVAGLVAIALALIKRRWIAAGVLIGLAAGMKQYAALAGILAIVYVMRVDRRALPRAVLSAGVVWLLLVGPYLWLDAHAFYQSTIRVYLFGPLRADSLSWIAWLRNHFGIESFGPWLPLSYLAILVLAGWAVARARGVSVAHWALASGAAYGSIFLLGKQAFCNYYYLVGSFVLLYFVFSLAEASSPREVATYAE